MHEGTHTDWPLAAWLTYLENRHTPEIQLRLLNVQEVAQWMGVEKWSIPVVTVAGTNGKGSTVAALSAIYHAAGYRVGQFTSPHLLAFNERICVNNQPISDAALCDAFQSIERTRRDVHLTYFEMSFLAALWYFKQSALDVMVLEVGVGGRLDATNIIDADLAIITTVDLDHQDYLGDNIESIGWEKAGILRHKQTFIYADTRPPNSVLNQAQALHVFMDALGRTYHYESDQTRFYLHMQDKPSPLVLPKPLLHLNAAAAAIVASERLRDRLPVQVEHWCDAMQNVRISARREWISVGGLRYLLDVAHNPQAAELLAQTLQEAQPYAQVHCVFSALKNKDICGLIRPLRFIINQWYVSGLNSNRAIELQTLLDLCEEELIQRPLGFHEPKDAFKAAVAAASPGDIIVVYGSFVLLEAVIKSDEIFYSLQI